MTGKSKLTQLKKGYYMHDYFRPDLKCWVKEDLWTKKPRAKKFKKHSAAMPMMKVFCRLETNSYHIDRMNERAQHEMNENETTTDNVNRSKLDV